MNNTLPYAETFQGLLDCEYYSLGNTGAEALQQMLEEYNNGSLADFLEEQGVSDAEFMMTVNRLAVKWASENLLNHRLGVDYN